MRSVLVAPQFPAEVLAREKARTIAGLKESAIRPEVIAALRGFVKMRDLPPGLARFLSKTSKQSVDSLEAEFDAMKRDGKEVEALLERPIGEVRG